jgi:Sec-independent protein translocase protein TatA
MTSISMFMVIIIIIIIIIVLLNELLPGAGRWQAAVG